METQKHNALCLSIKYNISSLCGFVFMATIYKVYTYEYIILWLLLYVRDVNVYLFADI